MPQLLGLVLVCAAAVQVESTENSTHHVVADKSVVAFVIYNDGFASGLLGNLLLCPERYRTEFKRGTAPEDVEFSIRVDADSLQINERATEERWYSRLKELAIVDDPFKSPSEARRKHIRRIMLSEKMLDAEVHPYIEAKTLHVHKDPGGAAGTAYRVGLEITFCGKTATVEWPALVEYEGDEMIVDTHGSLSFSGFGMTAYSSFLGAVRYRDDFHVYAHLVVAPSTIPKVEHSTTKPVAADLLCESKSIIRLFATSCRGRSCRAGTTRGLSASKWVTRHA